MTQEGAKGHCTLGMGVNDKSNWHAQVLTCLDDEGLSKILNLA